MAVRVVTDTTADLPPAILSELGITALPMYVRFGDQIYKDGIDITQDEFYARLPVDPNHPNTSQPTPQDFIEVYEKLAADGADGILSVHISRKMSGAWDSAMQAKKELEGKIAVEVVDSMSVTMGLGLLTLLGGRMARDGAALADIKAEVEKAIPQIHVLSLFDTLKYLAAGGRIGKAKALVGGMLNVKPVLIVKDGEMHPAGQVRSRAKGIDRLVEWASSFKDIADMSVGHTTTPEESDRLAELLGDTFPKDKIIKARLGAVMGTHTGPGTLFVALRTAG
jgi:DegV family protein with EDD domain